MQDRETPIDPKLNSAIAEIREIMDRIQAGGLLILASKTHAQYEFILPKWSAIQFVKDEKSKAIKGFRLRSKAEDYKDKTEQKEILESTCHIVYRLSDILVQMFGATENMKKKIEAFVDVDHNSKSGFTPI